MKLHQRPRRLRTSEAIRRLVREHRLSPDDFIWPLFVRDGKGCEDVDAMPGVQRLDEKGLLRACEQAAAAKIPCVALFPATASELRTEDGAEACNPKGLVPRLIARVKQEQPELLVLADVALDPYTSHGHDGVLDERGVVDNDRTVTILAEQALVLANAGADIIAPSDMMDGRIAFIRNALEKVKLIETKIMSYAAKYASAFYGPFRNAIGSDATLKGDKRGYQMDPGNSVEAIKETLMDVAEGSDMVMVKPGMPYLDIIARLADRLEVPLTAYQVSGEYSMLVHACEQGYLNREAAVLEALLAFKRAGCCSVLTYFALEACELLKRD